MATISQRKGFSTIDFFRGAELLELFQWVQPEEVIHAKRERLEEELADVLIYSLMMADNLDFDIEEIINKKLVKNAEKYPID